LCPRPPLKGGGEGRGEEAEKEGARERRPLPIRIPGYATVGPSLESIYRVSLTVDLCEG